MRLCVSTYSLWRWQRENDKSLEEVVDAIAGCDVAGIEFVAPIAAAKQDPRRRATELRKRAEKRALAVASYCVGAELLRPPGEQRKVVEQLKREVDVAAELGAPSMRHDVTRGFTGDHAPGLNGARSFEAALKAVVPAIGEVADYAASKNIRTSLENHGFYMQNSRRVERLIKAVAHENFGLTIDMGNFLCVNEDPVAAVRRLAKYAQMAHVKDFHVRPKKSMPPTGWFATPTPIALRGAIVGHGVINVPAEIKLLQAAGYDGFVSLEFEGMEEPLTAVKLGLDYLRPLV
jgi:sugar phosphate isomerase/epimerase